MKNINNTKVKHQNVNRKVISRINGKTYDLFCTNFCMSKLSNDKHVTCILDDIN